MIAPCDPSSISAVAELVFLSFNAKKNVKNVDPIKSVNIYHCYKVDILSCSIRLSPPTFGKENVRFVVYATTTVVRPKSKDIFILKLSG